MLMQVFAYYEPNAREIVMRLVRSLTVTVSSLTLAAAVVTTSSFFLHDSSSQSVINNWARPHNLTTAVVNFGASSAVVNF
jgi:hypothetical protein